jgi:hypothetical protein
VFFYDPRLENWKDDVLGMLRHDALLAELSRGGRILVEEKRSSEIMSDEVSEIFYQKDRE